MQVYSTLARSLTKLDTRRPGQVGMYVCGATVQGEPHVGHGRYSVVFDVVRRYLQWRGYEVTYVRNITDVEDKIIAAAAEAGETVEELAEKMAARFAEAYRRLGVEPPDVEPKATEHIAEMRKLIDTLIARGLAYPSNGDVYFSVRAFERYGALSGRIPDELRAGARVEVSELKRDPLDFALWKAAKPGEPAWDSRWGAGRPGWHIECSAMAAKYLGEGFDIHGGGADLIFPHHENEIAQSEGATGAAFARYWLHNGLVNLGGEKMSKSTGHLVDLESLIDRYGGMAVRLFYLRAHYRSPLEFTEGLVADAASAFERLARLRQRCPEPKGQASPGVLRRFRTAMDHDFATPEAVGLLFDLVRDANKALDEGEDARALVAAFHEIAEVLGLAGEEVGVGDLLEPLQALAEELGLPTAATAVEAVEALVAARAEARARRDWATSDRVRDRLADLGVAVEDAPDGVRWHRR
ncbi:MAG: cysteine--tRNA ligase [Acidimicrobiia bacterium]